MRRRPEGDFAGVERAAVAFFADEVDGVKGGWIDGHGVRAR
jgi:hypothetical protein